MNKSEKCSITQKNRIVIHKGDDELRIYKDDLEKYLKQGYSLGISEKHRKQLSEKHKGKEPPNKNKPMSKSTYDKLKNSGTWFKKGQSAWNKGLTKETDERVLKNTHLHSEETKRRISQSKMGHTFSAEALKKMSDSRKGKKLPPEKLRKKLEKDYITRKKNNTFNSSAPEKELLEKLKIENPNKTIISHYKDKDRYPYYCDFYIVEDDLFIELNAHWTHGGKPFDENDKECQEQLAVWKEKAKQSKFYEAAIETWTIRDVNKLQCAIKNKLNYQTIY